MAIQVTGILRDAFGNPYPNARMRVTPVTNSLAVLAGLRGLHVTGSDGSYDFPLGDGNYKIEVLRHNQYIKPAIVFIDDTVVSPITLEELVDGHAICEPEITPCTDEVSNV